MSDKRQTTTFSKQAAAMRAFAMRALRRVVSTRILLPAADAELRARRGVLEKEARRHADALWVSGDRLESLEAIRRHLAAHGGVSSTWHAYGARLLESGRSDAAFEAIKTAHDLDPLNFDALELLLEMLRLRQYSSRVREEAIDRAIRQANIDRRKSEGLIDFLVPLRKQRALQRLQGSLDPVVLAVLALDNADQANPSWYEYCASLGLTTLETEVIQARYLLGRGRRRAAQSLLDSLPEAALPVRAIRLSTRRALAAGKYAEANMLLEQYLRRLPEDRWARAKFASTRSDIRTDRELLESGYQFETSKPSSQFVGAPRNVLYTVYNSLPYHSAGYATRTHGLLTSLIGEGWRVRALTRLGYPFDTAGNKHLERVPALQSIDGVEYGRVNAERNVVSRKPLDMYLRQYSDALVKYAKNYRPQILHGASNHVNGLATVIAARALGIPSIYEVRGLWEVTRLSREPEWGTSEEYRFISRMEADAARGATAVITITGALRDELVRRGVPAEKITVVPNGVDVGRFSPVPPDEDLQARLQVHGRTVIGYIGSLLDYEGLDLLIGAARELKALRDDFFILIVGDGPERGKLDRLVADAGLESYVHFAGRVPHEEVARYYSVIDIAPFPRHSLPVCEMVSPLKPFEAMAMGKVVVASDVAALAEVVDDGVTGRLHRKGDSSSLAHVLNDLLGDGKRRSALACGARSWVTEERAWPSLASSVSDLYRSLLV